MHEACRAAQPFRSPLPNCLCDDTAFRVAPTHLRKAGLLFRILTQGREKLKVPLRKKAHSVGQVCLDAIKSEFDTSCSVHPRFSRTCSQRFPVQGAKLEKFVF
jgi:hypothetical protein